MRLDPEQLALQYLSAKERVIEAGFAHEIDWQEELSLEHFDETVFLRESAWVVLSGGINEVVVRACFGKISNAFFDWIDAETIISNSEACRRDALNVFRNTKKIDAILEIVDRVASHGVEDIREGIRNRGARFLQQLPYIGPITAFHLAKNLGLATAKPDRHLCRMAIATGYGSPEEMCRTISEVVGDSVSVVDIVIWRNATIRSK